MTHPTKAIYKWLLSDYVKVRFCFCRDFMVQSISNIVVNDMLYDEQDLIRSYEKIEVIDYHQVMDIDGIKFTPYNAGHVLGAAMFVIEIAGVKVVCGWRVVLLTFIPGAVYWRLFSWRGPSFDGCRKTSWSCSGCHDMRIHLWSTKPWASHSQRSPFHQFYTENVVTLRFALYFCTLMQRFDPWGCSAWWSLPDSRVCFGTGAGAAVDFGWILAISSWTTLHPHILRLFFGQKMHGRLPNLHQHDECQNSETNFHIESIYFQTHQLSEVDRAVWRYWAVCDDGQSWNASGSHPPWRLNYFVLQSGLSRTLFERWCPDKKNGLIIPGYVVEGTLAKVSHIASMLISTDN